MTRRHLNPGSWNSWVIPRYWRRCAAGQQAWEGPMRRATSLIRYSTSVHEKPNSTYRPACSGCGTVLDAFAGRTVFTGRNSDLGRCRLGSEPANLADRAALAARHFFRQPAHDGLPRIRVAIHCCVFPFPAMFRWPVDVRPRMPGAGLPDHILDRRGFSVVRQQSGVCPSPVQCGFHPLS